MPETIAAPTVSDAVALGLTEYEYDSICDQHGRAPNRVELAMSDAALTGFLAWLEAAPPGSYMDQIA